MADHVPDELCCAYRSMSNEERRLVTFELTATLRMISRKRAELEDTERHIQRIRELGAGQPETAYRRIDRGSHRGAGRRPSIEEIRACRESLNVPPLTEELLERAINEARV